MIKCLICDEDFKSYIGLGQHIKKHNIKMQQYYDLYLKKNINEGICEICKKPTRFVSPSAGYITTCSAKCAAIYCNDKREQTNLIKYGTKNPAQNKQIKEKIRNTVKSNRCQQQTKETVRAKYNCDYVNQSKEVKQKSKESVLTKYGSYSYLTKKSHITRNMQSEQFELDNDCTRIGKLIELYGQGWLHIKDQLSILNYKGSTYIKNDEIPKIIDYSENAFHNYSHAEKELAEYIKDLNIKVIENSRQIIKPYELDIFLPDYNVAIEYNGNYWHAIEQGTPKEYHLMKSLICRDKNIRLIHIYEFEDMQQQKQLIKDLILGKDNYSKIDFNKNNLINITNIKPEPVQTDQGTVYCAGKLY